MPRQSRRPSVDPAQPTRAAEPATSDAPPPVPRQRLWPIADAAKELHCHPVTLYKRAQAGKITLVKLGRRTYITGDELDRYIATAVPYVSGGRG